MENYDIVVLGGGPGGYIAAIKAAQLGAKTAIIEKSHWGGTCLNVGCIPTKTLVKNAEILHSIESASWRGISVGKPEIDMKKTIDMKNGVVKQLSSGVKGLLMSNGIDIYNGFGRVRTDKKIDITDEDGKTEEISFDKLIVATGTSNFIPPVDGLDHEGILTSTEILNLEEVPEHLLIIGGGVIGCEFATVFSAFGSKVTIVEMLPRLLPAMDKDISAMLVSSLERNGVDIHLNSRVDKVEHLGDTYDVTIVNDDRTEILKADKVLVSVGRTPNLEGLEALELDRDGGFIKVSDRFETSFE